MSLSERPAAREAHAYVETREWGHVPDVIAEAERRARWTTHRQCTPMSITISSRPQIPSIKNSEDVLSRRKAAPQPLWTVTGVGARTAEDAVKDVVVGGAQVEADGGARHCVVHA